MTDTEPPACGRRRKGKLTLQYILASQSPRRRELLSLLFDSFAVCPADIDETLRADQPLAQEVQRLAAEKALAAAKAHPDAVAIGSDTLVELDGSVFGKPRDAQDAHRMLSLLSGRTHRVWTGAAVVLPGCGADTLLNVTEVTFRTLSEAEIAAYVATGEPLDKAGAYGIQGKGALLVAGICGDYYSVMGLPVAQLYERLGQLQALPV